MISLLKVKNFGIFDRLEVEFFKGLNVITGESGSGKSLILKAIDFLFGGRPSGIFLKHGDENICVECVLLDKQQEIIVRREINPQTNRSRFYVDDSLMSLRKIKELREKFILYAEQDAQRIIGNSLFIASMVDSYLPGEIFEKRKIVLKELNLINRQVEELLDKLKELRDKKEFWEFQIKEIEKIDPKPQEEQELERRKRDLKSKAEIQAHVQKALELLISEGGVEEILFEFQKSIEKISQLDHDVENFLNDMENFLIVLKEIKEKLLSYPVMSEVEIELEKIEERLWKLSQIKKRFNKNIEDIIEMKENIKEELEKVEEYESLLKDLKKRQKLLIEDLKEIIEKINLERRKKVKELSLLLKEELLELGFNKKSEIRFEFERRPLLGDVIYEDIPIPFWKPNLGIKPLPLKEIASGGEVSRIFIALMLISATEEDTTLIFDEVESGIGGMTLSKVGEKIKNISKKNQVIMISHWPVIASMADAHFVVDKRDVGGKTISQCRILKEEERLKELSRMSGGGEKGILLAQKLMEEMGKK